MKYNIACHAVMYHIKQSRRKGRKKEVVHHPFKKPQMHLNSLTKKHFLSKKNYKWPLYVLRKGVLLEQTRLEWRDRITPPNPLTIYHLPGVYFKTGFINPYHLSLVCSLQLIGFLVLFEITSVMCTCKV